MRGGQEISGELRLAVLWAAATAAFRCGSLCFSCYRLAVTLRGQARNGGTGGTVHHNSAWVIHQLVRLESVLTILNVEGVDSNELGVTRDALLLMLSSIGSVPNLVEKITLQVCFGGGIFFRAMDLRLTIAHIEPIYEPPEWLQAWITRTDDNRSETLNSRE
jgi:hypothetical protein